jgi:preprotein translocase subunit YajC
MDDTVLNIALVVVLALFVVYTIRSSRKNKAKQADLKSQIVPGAEVMTNFGLFGTLLSIDEVSNEASLEVSPGNVVRVHRQTLAKVVTPTESVDGVVASGEPRSVEEAMEIATREQEARDRAASGTTPAYGELAEPSSTAIPAADGTDPVVPPTTKKVDE